LLSSHSRPAQLLVVASRAIAVQIGRQLASEGMVSRWRLHVAHSVTAAWQRMSETNFDLAIVDLALEEVRLHVEDLVASAGAALVYGLSDDEHSEVAMAARRVGVADVLSTHHLEGPSTGRLLRLMLDSARTASYSRLLAAAVEGAPVAYAISDALQADMPLVYVNEFFVTLTGYQPSDVIGRNCRFLQGPDTDSRDVDRIREAIRRAQPLYIELINYRKDGQSFWNGMLLRPIRSLSGAITHFVATLRDMTERRGAEASLERSARLHRLLVEASGGITLFCDPDGHLRAPVAEFEAFTGLNYDQYRSGDFSQAIHAEDRDGFAAARLEAFDERRAFRDQMRLWNAPTSAWRYVELRMLPLIDPQGVLTEWIGMLTDIHDRLTTDLAQQQSSQFVHTLFDTLPTRVAYADPEGVIRYVNRSCEEWLQQSRDRLIGMRLRDAIDAAGRDTFDIDIGAALGGQGRRRSEVVTIAGKQECVDMQCVPYRNDQGQVAGVLVTITA
jgi:PAS domain S-box-containing protein